MLFLASALEGREGSASWPDLTVLPTTNWIVLINVHVYWKMRFLFLIWHLNMWGHLKFAYETPNRTVANQTAMNWTMCIKPCPALPNMW